MIKRLIFDFDNTLVMWKDKYLSVLYNLIEKYNLKCDPEELNYAIGDCISYTNRGMTVENVIKQAKEICDVEISEEFVVEWFKGLGEEAIELEEDIVDTLEYLSKKYSLVILSNFNGEVQKSRTYHANIDKYFDDIYGSDTIDMKPHPNSYKKAIGNYHIDECIMIGDNLKEDIEGALEIGLKAIYFDRKNIRTTNDNYQIIHQFKDLKNKL